MPHPSSSSKRKTGSFDPAQDYRNINKWTVRNQYPLPLITTLIRDLGGAMIYTKLDVRWGYNNVRIKQEMNTKQRLRHEEGFTNPL